MERIDLTIFDLSPISMWLQDFSGVKKIFQRWKSEGIEDLEAFLLEDSHRLNECLLTIHTLHVNPSTLALYEAQNLEEILINFMNFLTPEVTTFQIKFFCSLWNNNSNYAIPVVNYTCKGKQIDVQLSASIVTGYEDSWEILLLTTEHISDYQNARRFAESIFMHSPTALWVKDYSEIKKRFNILKQQGVNSLEAHIEHHPDFIQTCFQSIKSVHTNQALLSLFKVKNKQNLDQHLSQICNSQSQQNFYLQLLHLWQNHQSNQQASEYECECLYTSINGNLIYVQEKLNIFPDATDSWDTIQVAYTDFTQRKALENHLHYVSKYDQLTKLHNRTFFNEEIARLNADKIYPISCIYMDINGLKTVNDQQGHHSGDLLLQRFASILIQATQNKNCSVSRIGGDEFVILMPHATEKQAKILIDEIENLLSLENVNHPKISIASGFSCTADNQANLENLIKIADGNMYRKKRNHYDLISS